MSGSADQRTLIIVRHAKAERPGDVADLDRPLTERGHADSSAAGAWLTARGYRPDLVICSPAKRTRQTWHGIAVALSKQPAEPGGTDAPAGGAPQRPAGPLVRYEPALYDSRAEEILRVVRALEPGFHTALLIGHNPTMSNLSAMLDPGAGRDSDGLRTGGIAVHRLDGTWDTCGPGRAHLVAGHTARMQ
jgi:phosphohistidine phosphatase